MIAVVVVFIITIILTSKQQTLTCNLHINDVNELLQEPYKDRNYAHSHCTDEKNETQINLAKLNSQ